MARLRITKPHRFVAFWVCVALITLTGYGVVAARQSAVAYVEIVVEPGDTLWAIAQRYTSPGQDLRELVWELRRINQLPDALLHPGQVLRVPR
ncbi:MAG: LysM peptidoglycan-binding domain-containing protein [Bacillota bacterium]